MIIVLFDENAFCQKKNNLFMDMGLGIQFSNAKIQGSSYNSFVQTPNPKLFLAIGFEHRLNERIKLCMNLNANNSKTETYFNYFDETSRTSYSERNYHKDINYGYALGISYKPHLFKGRFSLGTGLNFQKLSVQTFKSNYKFSSDVDTSVFMHFPNTNDFSKNYNSLLCYINYRVHFWKEKEI